MLEGSFHFRFKYKYNGQSVWMDLNNKSCKVPKCDNKIIMKVSRKEPKDLLAKPSEHQPDVEQFFNQGDSSGLAGSGLLL